MPLTAELAGALPHSPGVYIYIDSTGREIYIGKAKDLRKRVSSYLNISKHDRHISKLVASVVEVKYIETADEIEALISEARLIRELRPEFNRMLKNSEHFPWLEFTLGEEYPRVDLTRAPDNPKSRYIGPFTDVAALRLALRAVQPIFRFCTCTRRFSEADPDLRRNRPCLNSHLGLCDAPCAGRISKDNYRKRIKAMILFFSGRKETLIADMKTEMERVAAEYRYEEAATLRDQIAALTKLAKPSKYSKGAVTFASMVPEQGLAALQKALNLPTLPQRIEGYDISNLGEHDVVGSLVCFLSGMPYKAGYRRFRIKTVEGQNDFACIEEVIARRLRHILDGDEPPDLLLIDGGPGQVRFALNAMEVTGVHVPVIGLAKQEEVIHFSDGREPLVLPRNSVALRLLQQVRDEAHRFAQHYSQLLRAKRVIPGYVRHRKKRGKKPS